MNTITIPKELARKGDLVVIPREEYEAFSRWKKLVKVRAEDEWFWTKEWQKKEKETDEAFKRGEYKEFKNVRDLIKDLRR